MGIHERRRDEKDDAEAILRGYILKAMEVLEGKYEGIPSEVDVDIMQNNALGTPVVQNHVLDVRVQW